MNSRLFRTAMLGSALALTISTAGAQASGFTVIHSFAGGSNDGQGPFGGVAPAGKGDFYVATDGGGASNRGTLALVRRDGSSQVLHTFTGGTDGQNADGTPIVWSIDGNLYGTTQFGGFAGCGTIYRYTPSTGSYQQMYAAGCAPDGAFPFAGLLDTGFGYLAGTAYNGGADDDGTLVYLNEGGGVGSSCTSSFSGSNGSHPYGGIIAATNGNLYAVTTAGGSSNLGTIVEFPGQTCNPIVLHNFVGGGDGANPYGTLLSYRGALYGTTSGGGEVGLGTVFKIKSDGSGYKVLYQFQGIFNNSDGSFPHSGLTLNRVDSMLYGTTINGGNSSDLGTVFKIDPKSGAETVVHAFGGSDGAHPYGNLYIKRGSVYGTTAAGGASNLGVVFKLTS